jgi:recombinational DNA repair protein (RecF pathway)
MAKRLKDEETVPVMRAAGLEPLEPYPGKNALPWRCRCLQCGDEVAPNYGRIQQGGGGCRSCGIEKAASARRLPAEEAEGVMRAAGLEPLEPYTAAIAPWRCECKRCGREVTPAYNSIQQGRGGCRACGMERFGELLREDADAAVAVMRSAGLEPLEPYPGSQVSWLSRCLTCGSEVGPRYTSVKNRGTGCRFCASKAAGESHRLDPVEAEGFMTDNGLEPLEPYPGANEPWRCRCLRCESEVTPKYSSVQQGHGCKVCAGASRGDQSRLTTEKAEASMIAAGLQPLEPYPGLTSSPWLCRCVSCGRETQPRLNNIRNGRGGCNFCGLKASVEARKLDPLAAESAMHAAGAKPLVPYPSTNEPWLCECLTCGREITPRLSDVKRGQGCCIYCTGTWVDPAEVEAFMVANGVRPLETYKSALTPWRCECLSCGREVNPRYNDLKSGQGGCRYCADWGIDYDAPSIVYLVASKDLNALKVGITTASNNSRLDAHRRNGWLAERVWQCPTGYDAERVEQAVLEWWRNSLGAPEATEPEDMPQGGFTETASLFHVDLDETTARIGEMVKALTAVQQPVCSAT